MLRNVSLQVGRGESYGLVGESGCGKSTAALSVVRYLPRAGQVTGGQILVDGADVLAMDDRALRRLRAEQVAMVYQDPSNALNPSMRIGEQVAEVFHVRGLSAGDAADGARDMLERVRIADPGSVMRRYPHQLSGGMQQRVVIAMALAADPGVLVLDEPTTGLDATVEAEVLDLIAQLRTELNTSVLFISHNLAVIARTCERVGVLYAGELVEEAEVDTLFDQPRHPYTVGLLRCLPVADARKLTHRLQTVPGTLPAAGHQITGCIFRERCGLAQDICRDHTATVRRGRWPSRAVPLPRRGGRAPPRRDGRRRGCRRRPARRRPAPRAA